MHKSLNASNFAIILLKKTGLNSVVIPLVKALLFHFTASTAYAKQDPLWAKLVKRIEGLLYFFFFYFHCMLFFRKTTL